MKNDFNRISHRCYFGLYHWFSHIKDDYSCTRKVFIKREETKMFINLEGSTIRCHNCNTLFLQEEIEEGTCPVCDVKLTDENTDVEK